MTIKNEEENQSYAMAPRRMSANVCVCMCAPLWAIKLTIQWSEFEMANRKA